MPKTLPATRHFQLAQKLRKQILGMEIGAPLPTVAEMRQQFACSQATIERALDRLRREGLVERPAGQLRLTVAANSDPAAYRVAMIRPDYPSPTFEELARVIIEAGKARNWAFELQSYRQMSGLNLTKLLRDADGAVLVPTSERFPDHLLRALKRPHRPIVIIQDPPPGLRVSSVRIDDEEIGRGAVKHLAELGHRRILLLVSEPPAPSGDLRIAGWRQAMEELGQENIDELIVKPNLKPFDNSLLSTYEYFNQWLSKPHPHFTAVFCPAWTGAAAALRALREHRIEVPRQVSVVGHGGEGYIGPFLFPALTAMETDVPAYGERVVQVLHDLLKGQKKVRNLTVSSKLVLRQTCAPPPSRA